MKQEFDFALKDHHTYMEPFTVHRVKDIVTQLAGKKVYITIDLDILDPSIFPGTGTPEPGGITYRELETVFKAIKDADIELVGADMVELSPHYDTANVSTIVACKSIKRISIISGDNSNR